METESFYDILGLPSDASAEEIKRAFRDLARRFHPDKHPDKNTVDTFQKISEAYNVLSDPNRRMSYDLKMGLNDSDGDGESEYDQPPQRSEQRRERRMSKINIKALHQMVRDGYDDGGDKKDGAAAAKSRRKEGENSSVNRLGVRLSPAEKIAVFIRQFLRKVEKKAEATAIPKAAPKAATASQALRRDSSSIRTFVFTIDALESVIGTIREVAFDELGEPRVLKIRIPAGVHDDSVIDAASMTDDPTEVEVVRARVRIKPHKYVERDGYDITIKVPVTVAEVTSGAELEIPTPNGPAKFQLPPRWNVEQKYRMKGLGLQHAERKFRGDLYIQAVVVPPNHTSQALDEAAKMVDSFYFNPVRQTFPKNLFDPKRGG